MPNPRLKCASEQHNNKLRRKLKRSFRSKAPLRMHFPPVYLWPSFCGSPCIGNATTSNRHEWLSRSRECSSWPPTNAKVFSHISSSSSADCTLLVSHNSLHSVLCLSVVLACIRSLVCKSMRLLKSPVAVNCICIANILNFPRDQRVF